MRRRISFNSRKTNQVCFYEQEDFFESDFITSLEFDLKEFINKNLNKNKAVLSDKGTRLNIQNGDANYEKLIKFSKSWRALDERLFDGKFFKKVFIENKEIFKYKGLIFENFEYDKGYNDYSRFSPEFLSKLKRKFIEFFKIKHLKHYFNFYPKSIIIYPIINIALSKFGYEVPIHTDNRYKVLVGLIYLNTLEDGIGGETIFHKLKNKKELKDCRRYEENTEIIKKIKPKKNKLVVFLNSNDSYHSVSSLKKSTDRNFIYFSFAVKNYENVWKTNYKVIDGGV